VSPAFERRLRRYIRPDLLVLDELGYLLCDSRAADILYNIISRRHEQRSTIITTNLAFKQRSSTFPGAACVVALVDRFAQHCYRVEILGESYRDQHRLDRDRLKPATTRSRRRETIVGPLTVRKFATDWIAERQELDLDWKNDESQLRHHVYPVIGGMKIANVRTRHIIELFHRIRTSKEHPVAQRTVYSIYSVVSALFRDANVAARGRRPATRSAVTTTRANAGAGTSCPRSLAASPALRHAGDVHHACPRGRGRSAPARDPTRASKPRSTLRAWQPRVSKRALTCVC
jgi:hypothetical protein